MSERSDPLNLLTSPIDVLVEKCTPDTLLEAVQNVTDWNVERPARVLDSTYRNIISYLLPKGLADHLSAWSEHLARAIHALSHEETKRSLHYVARWQAFRDLLECRIAILRHFEHRPELVGKNSKPKFLEGIEEPFFHK